MPIIAVGYKSKASSLPYVENLCVLDERYAMIKENYDRIKAEAKQIVTDGIRNDENLRHLLPKEE
jgi:hypothetical protein